MKLVKNGSAIEVPGDEPIIELVIMRSGQMRIHAPMVHPRDVCKFLNNVATDLMFANFQPAEVSKIQTPM
jgi:hypothetical protein